MKHYKDDYGNTATIEMRMMKPYNDATHKEPAYILSVYDSKMFMYIRNVYETNGNALNKLSEISCGTFKEDIQNA